MLVVRNKKESVEIMKELGVNYFPLQVFEKEDIKGIEKFFNDYPSKEYILRNTDKAKGGFYFVNNFNEALSFLEKFEKRVTVGVSYNPFKNNIVLVGDIKIEKSEDNVFVNLTARTDKNATHRNIYDKPKYNLNCTIEDDKLWEIDGMGDILKYITEYGLLNCIVEFAVYDKKLGVNNENVVISEIRTGY